MNNAVALAIKVTSDARQASAGIDGATSKVSKLGRAGQVAGRLLAAGLLVAAGAAIKFANAAAEDQAAQAQLAQTAQRAAGATAAQTSAMEDWIAAQGKAVGVTDDELRPALSKLITATGSVEKAQKLAAVAMDVSARSGKSLDSVAQAIAKAQNGSVAGLGKYGIATKDAAGHTKSLAQVQKELADNYKGASAAAADTAAGKTKRMQVAMGELQEEIGLKLIPVLSKVAEVGLQVVDWIDKNQAAAGTILGVLGGLLAILKAISIAQGVLNLVMAANPIVLVVVAVVALAAALVIAYKKSETFRRIVDAAFGGISKVVGATVDFIRDHWRLIIAIIGGPIGIAVGLVTKHWDTIKNGAILLVAVIREKFRDVREFITGVWDKITSTFSAAKNTLETTASNIKSTLVGAFDAVASAIQKVVDKVQAVIDKIKSIPHPDVPFVGRVASGAAGGSLAGTGLPSKAPRGDVHVHVHLDGRSVIGDRADLARFLKGILAEDALRYNGAAA